MHSIHSGTRSADQPRAPRARRGVALVFVLIFVVAMAALAMSSIFMASNANLLAKSYDRERELKYAADAALQMGKSRVNADPSVLVMNAAATPPQIDTLIIDHQPLMGADGIAVPGIKISVYAGPSGSTSGQFGRFSSILAIAEDANRHNAFIRRLELTQESFAKFAYWSNQENVSGTGTIYFGGGDQIWGPVWSNDTISIHSTTATFHDVVGTHGIVVNPSYGTFTKGYQTNQPAIALPSVAQLTTLVTLAGSSGWAFTSTRAASNDENSVRDRIEFYATDMNGSGDSTDLNEGFFKIYRANNDGVLRGDYPGPTASGVNFCGDWHYTRPNQASATGATQQFFPASVHATNWFVTQVSRGLQDSSSTMTLGTANGFARADSAASLQTIMSHPNARCYLPGDNHLAAVERQNMLLLYPSPSQYQKGGADTTFTPVGQYGSWQAATVTPPAALVTLRNAQGFRDAAYLYALDRGYNSNAKGVITFTGNVGLSGTLNGRVTLYAAGTIVLLDDLRYASDPVTANAQCFKDMFGILAGRDVVIADNTQNTPQLVTAGVYKLMDEGKDLDIHGVIMALSNSFRVQNFTTGPFTGNSCGASINGRGCINLSGGIIQNIRGAVGLSSGYGYLKRYTYDHCAVINPPPYFPTTGRFQENRYLELDPAGFNHRQYFLTLTP